MAIFSIPKSLVGGMDKNSNMEDIAPTDYIDAVDITDKSIFNGNEQGLKQLNNDADFSYDVGSISLQKKRYQLSIDFTLTSLNVSTPSNVNLVLGIEKKGSYREYISINDGGAGLTVVQWRTAILNQLVTSYPILGTSIISTAITGSNLTIIFECNYFGYSDWIFSVHTQKDVVGVVFTDNDNIWPCYAQPLLDAFSQDKVGALQRIKMSNKGDELFTFSTTGTKEEVLYSQEYWIVTVGGIDLGAFFYVAGINDGDEVFVYFEDEVNDGLSSFYSVQLVTILSVQYFVLQGSQNWKTNYVPNPRGGANVTIIKYRNSASTIGVSIKNEVSGENTYTELVRSNKLNFRTYKPITDAIITSTDRGANFDWTDKLNPIRRMLYEGEWMTNGFLTLYNPLALYDLDTINEESQLQLGQNTSKISMTVDKTGGIKPSATYIGFVRFLGVADGSQTSWSHYSNMVWTRNTSLAYHNYNDATEMALRILIEQIPLNQFEFAQVGIVQINETGYEAYTLPPVLINGQESLTIVDTGDTTKYGTFDVSTEVEIPLVVFENAQNLQDFDNYIETSNVKLALPYDLSDFAQNTITLTTVKRDMTVELDYADNQQSQAWLQNGYNNPTYMNQEWMSCMPSETHRVGLVIDWKNGSPTSYFWIADHYIDPSVTDYKVTDDTSASTAVYQYFIQASAININYLLPDGKLLRDVVKDIRFSRTVVKKEVLATGLGMASLSTLAPHIPYVNSTSPTNITAIKTNAPSAGGAFTINSSSLLFYSPDLINKGQTIKYEAGDEVIGIAPNIQKQINLTTLGVPNSYAIDTFGDNQESSSQTIPVNEVQDLYAGQVGTIIDLGSSGRIGTGCVTMVLASDLLPQGSNRYPLYILYYKRPETTPYPSNPQDDRFFIVPQDKWYDESTHDLTTTYNIYSGDCFPQKQYYRVQYDEDATLANKYAYLIGFYSYNRFNGAIRSGQSIGYGFPNQSVFNILTDNTISDDYFIDDAFLPRNIFQSAQPYNPNLPYTYQTIATLYWSGRRLNGALYGNNRIWKFNDNGVIDNTLGKIMGHLHLLGTSGNNAIFTIQERATSLQYFQNSSKLISTSVEILLGQGDILETKGTFLSTYGCSHKFSIVKCSSPTSGKDFLIWFDVTSATINRFGADGSGVISNSISSFLKKYTTLAKLSQYNNEDRPAHDYGVLAGWDNQKKEYNITLKLIAKNTDYSTATAYVIGNVVNNGTTFGFENIPILYKCIKANTNQPLTNTTYWVKYDSYIDELHQCYTLVWNELDNKWKGFYSYLPKLYGNVTNNFFSGHPTEGNLVYEHNQDNHARYYCSVPELLGIDNSTIEITSDGYKVNGNGTTFGDYFGVSSYPFTPTLDNHTSYYFYNINTKTYHRIIEFLANDILLLDINENIDSSQLLPTELPSYASTCNSGQPYIEGVVNENQDEQSRYLSTTLEIDLIPPRLDLKTRGQISYNVASDFDEYSQDRASVGFGYDTTNNPNDNMADTSNLFGRWLRMKTNWQPNIKNKLRNFVVRINSTAVKIKK